MTTTSTDLACRQDLFRCLSVLFCEPQGELWREERVLDRLVEAAADGAPGAEPHARRLRDTLDASDALALSRDHARLFVGPGPLAAAPYGSVYLDGERRLMGPSTDRVLDALRSAGLEVDGSAFEAPDHIAAELELMQYLDWKTIAAGPDTAEAMRLQTLRRRFVAELVATWTPAFAAAIRGAEPAPFYAALADCLDAAIAAEQEHGG